MFAPTMCSPPSRRPKSWQHDPVAMKGKWAQGIHPRNFHWIMKDQLAVCERPGGYGANHRRVRRQEEIIWVREQGFTLRGLAHPAPHNLHNYDELGVHVAPPPLPAPTSGPVPVEDLPGAQGCSPVRAASCCVHQEELGDRSVRADGRLPAVGRAGRHGAAGDLGHRADHPAPARTGRSRAGLGRARPLPSSSSCPMSQPPMPSSSAGCGPRRSAARCPKSRSAPSRSRSISTWWSTSPPPAPAMPRRHGRLRRPRG